MCCINSRRRPISTKRLTGKNHDVDRHAVVSVLLLVVCASQSQSSHQGGEHVSQQTHDAEGGGGFDVACSKQVDALIASNLHFKRHILHKKLLICPLSYFDAKFLIILQALT